jgi:molybdenum cofactor synthesis domain-containing protein
MDDAKTVSAALVIIGNEVLSGRTKDANLAYLGENLNAIGIQLLEVRVITDDEAAIVAAVNACRVAYDYVFTTGGIGPTHDDITTAAVAVAFAVAVVRNSEAEAVLRAHYKMQDITEARLKMADVPDGATLLENPVSKAPGYRIGNVYVLPGVPRIMQAIFEGLRHTLVGGAPMLSCTVTSRVQEGVAGQRLGELQTRYPQTAIGSYPFIRDGKPGTCLVVRCTDQAMLDEVADEIRKLVRSFGHEVEAD